jgi:zinc protease
VNLEETTIDGVYTLFVPRDDPTTRAGLVFRVGQADESLAVRGLTHLVQHLALHEVSGGNVHRHGSTGVMHTEFTASGTGEEVAEFLSSVAAALREPPTHLLGTVREVLESEDVATDRSARRSAAVRHGAQGHGLESYPELGLPGLGEVDVATWAQVAFTRGNAVLWVVGRHLPRGLDLELPDGTLVEAPPLPSVLARTPAWYLDPGSGEVELTALLPRTPAADLTAALLARAVRHDTTAREPIADEVTLSCAPRDADLQVVTLLVRGRPEVAPALVGSVVDAVAALQWGTPTDDELAGAREDLLEEGETGDAVLELLPRLAVGALLGDNPARRPDPAHALASVTAEQVCEVAEHLHRTALVRAPDPGLSWAGFAEVPSGSTWAVEGDELLAVDGSDEVLVLSGEGVTRHSGFRKASVRYGEVALLQRFGDGGRWLTGRDGTEVRVEPRLFDIPKESLEYIDEVVDAAHVVHLPARGTERLPGANYSALVELKDAAVRAAIPVDDTDEEPEPQRRGLAGLFRRR